MSVHINGEPPMTIAMMERADAFVVIVDGDKDQREAFRREFAQHPEIAAFVQDSMLDACILWYGLVICGCTPRGVIVDWNLVSDDCSELDVRDGITKAGAHYMIKECCDMCEDSLMVCYTASPQIAINALKGSKEQSRVNVISKKDIDTHSLVQWVVTHSAFSPQKLSLQ